MFVLHPIKSYRFFKKSCTHSRFFQFKPTSLWFLNLSYQIRDQTVEAMNLWLGVERNVLQKIKELVTMLHEASLLIDDIQDNSKMRRGQPAAYLIYGVSEVGDLSICRGETFFILKSWNVFFWSDDCVTTLSFLSGQEYTVLFLYLSGASYQLTILLIMWSLISIHHFALHRYCL